ncbi:MAG: hypothetical protein PHW74_00600 [Desulfobacca sp.]|nr:hypothetical protein [Desulfobacca sp.]
MRFLAWLAEISQSAAPPGQPFAPQWLYVALALVIPALVGVGLAFFMNAIERASGMKFGGGSV